MCCHYLGRMENLGDIPHIIYIDESQVNNLFSMMNKGRVSEILQRDRELDNSTKGVGIKKILQLQYSGSSEDESETEVVKQMNLVGEFATIYTLLLDSDSLRYIGDLGDDSRDDIDDGDFIESVGKISPSPLNELEDKFSDILPFLNLMQDAGVEEAEELEEFELEGASNTVGVDFFQKFITQLSNGKPLYNLAVEGDESSLVFEINPNYFQDKSDDFPSEYTDYRMIARVEHVYSEQEEEMLIDALDMINENDREARTERRKALKGAANGLEDALGRSVSDSDLKISHPDIRVRPMAIYLF